MIVELPCLVLGFVGGGEDGSQGQSLSSTPAPNPFQERVVITTGTCSLGPLATKQD